MNRFTSWRRVLVVAAVLLLASTGSVFAQEQTGNLYGTVTDNEGGALPGVRVELTGVGAPRTQFTGPQGQFRFLNLDPGNYGLTASLEGFSTVEYPNVNIRVGRNTTLEIKLSPAVEEVITVTSESPLLDERKVSAGTTVSQIELEKIPTARDPWAIVTQTPGVLSDRVNVGGDQSGQQAVFTAPGVSDNENSFAVDGVIITDMAAIGSSPTYYDFDQFEEIQVSTGGTDIEKVSAGASLNLVTKRGSNNPRGSARYLLTDARREFDIFKAGTVDINNKLENGDGNGGLNQQTRSDTPGNTVDSVVDSGFEAGGPIVRDRLWVWGSYGRNDITQINSEGITDATLLENSAIKVNGQPTGSNSIVGSWNRGDKIKKGRTGTSGRSFDAAWNQDGPTEIWKIEDTQVFSADLYLTGLYSYVDGGFQLQSRGGSFPAGVTTTDVATAIDNGETYQDEAGIWQNGWYSGASDRNTDNYQVDGSYFFNTGSLNHELKFGVSYRKFETVSNFGWAGGRNSGEISCEAAGTCPYDILLASRSGPVAAEQKYTAGWLQDTLTTGNWTINAGLRYDIQEGKNVGGEVPANPLFPDRLPAIQFAGNDAGGFKWKTFSPRVGVTYALGEERKTLLRASYSRFAEQLSSTPFFRTNPVGIATATYFYIDSNNNNYYDVGEPNIFINNSGFDPANPGSLSVPNENDPGLDPAYTDELILGVEHAFLPEFVVGADFTYRLTQNISETQTFIIDETGTKRRATPADYVLDQTITSDGVTVPFLPDGSSWSAPVYTYRNGISPAGGSYLTNGDREVEYKGASLNFTKRLSNRWMARGYLQYSDQTWNVPSSYFRYNSPNDAPDGSDNDGSIYTVASAGSGPFGDVLIQSSWSANVNGLYQVAPDRPWGFNVAGNLFAREGYPLPYYYHATASDGRTYDVSAVGGNIDRFRADNIYVLDLRVEKDMQFSDNLSGVLSLDAFNVTNENYVMQRERNLQSPRANFLDQNLAPRIYRLGFRLNWR